MFKTLIKEFCIVLLITLAVGLILALIFYQYLPSNKIIPSKITAYSTPEDVAKEIEEEEEEELEALNTVYTITDADLSLYKSEKSYNPGKVDPFAESAGTSEESGGSGVSAPSASGGQTASSPDVNKNTTDNYYTASGVGSGTK